jgi:hypothetical protein
MTDLQMTYYTHYSANANGCCTIYCFQREDKRKSLYVFNTGTTFFRIFLGCSWLNQRMWNLRTLRADSQPLHWHEVPITSPQQKWPQGP